MRKTLKIEDEKANYVIIVDLENVKSEFILNIIEDIEKDISSGIDWNNFEKGNFYYCSSENNILKCKDNDHRLSKNVIVFEQFIKKKECTKENVIELLNEYKSANANNYNVESNLWDKDMYNYGIGLMSAIINELQENFK